MHAGDKFAIVGIVVLVCFGVAVGVMIEKSYRDSESTFTRCQDELAKCLIEHQKFDLTTDQREKLGASYFYDYYRTTAFLDAAKRKEARRIHIATPSLIDEQGIALKVHQDKMDIGQYYDALLIADYASLYRSMKKAAARKLIMTQLTAFSVDDIQLALEVLDITLEQAIEIYFNRHIVFIGENSSFRLAFFDYLRENIHPDLYQRYASRVLLLIKAQDVCELLVWVEKIGARKSLRQGYAEACYDHLIQAGDTLELKLFVAEIGSQGLTAQFIHKRMVGSLWACLSAEVTSCDCVNRINQLVTLYSQANNLGPELYPVVSAIKTIFGRQCFMAKIEALDSGNKEAMADILAEAERHNITGYQMFFAGLEALLQYKTGNLRAVKQIIRDNNLDLTQMMVIFSAKDSVSLLKMAYWY